LRTRRLRPGHEGASVGLLLAGPDIALLYPLTGVPLPATPPYELGGKLDYTERRFRFTDVPGGWGGATSRGR
jgi:AsmA family protein